MRLLGFRFQYRLRTLLLTGALVATGFALWSWWIAGEQRRRLIKTIRESKELSEPCRHALLGMVRGNRDLEADPFPQIGIFYDIQKYFNVKWDMTTVDDSFRFFPLGQPEVAWQSKLPLPDGSVRRLILFETDPNFGFGLTLCLLDPSYGVVGWRGLGIGLVRTVRTGSIGSDLFLEVELEPSGSRLADQDPVTTIRFRLTEDSLDCLWLYDGRLWLNNGRNDDPNVERPGGLQNVKEWNIGSEREEMGDNQEWEYREL